MAARPSWSGGWTIIVRSNRPGRSSAGSSTSGRLVAARTITPSWPEKPSISVRIWLRVCSRSSCPPKDLAPARVAADGVDLVDEDDRGRDLARLAEQLAHAARADADDHLDELAGARAEEGNVRLAGGSPRQQCFAGSRRPGEEHALRRAGAQPLVLAPDPSGNRRSH